VISALLRARNLCQCREHYKDDISPSPNDLPWTPEEDEVKDFVGQSDMAIRNRWMMNEMLTAVGRESKLSELIPVDNEDESRTELKTEENVFGLFDSFQSELQDFNEVLNLLMRLGCQISNSRNHL